MALISCPDCGKDVSARAPVCPNCGAPIAKGTVADSAIHGRGEGMFMKGLNCGCLMLVMFVGGIMLLGIIGSM